MMIEVKLAEREGENERIGGSCEKMERVERKRGSDMIGERDRNV